MVFPDSPVYWFSLFRFLDQQKTPLRKQGLALTIKVIKRVMYGRNSFELLKAKVLFGELFHVKFN